MPREGGASGNPRARFNPTGLPDRPPFASDDRNGFAILGYDVAERARRRRRDFNRDLVGLKLDQGLIDRDRIAGLLEPAADGGLGHGFTERRNANFSHDVFPQYPFCRHRPQRRAIQYAGTIVIDDSRRGVLNAPPSRGMTSETR